MEATRPGLSFRVPLLQSVETYDIRWLYLNTEPLPIQTRDGEELNVDNYVIWRISDPVEFRRAFRSQMSNARARIDRVVRDDVREVIGRHTLLEVLEHLGAASAREIVIAVNDPGAAERAAKAVRRVAPEVHVLVRSQYLGDVPALLAAGASAVVPAALEVAAEITTRVLKRQGVAPDEIRQQVERIHKRGSSSSS